MPKTDKETWCKQLGKRRYISANPGLCRGGAWDHRRCGALALATQGRCHQGLTTLHLRTGVTQATVFCFYQCSMLLLGGSHSGHSILFLPASNHKEAGALQGSPPRNTIFHTSRSDGFSKKNTKISCPKFISWTSSSW